MSDVPLPKITLKYDGLFDFEGLYAAITDWAKNYGFLWHESDYKHKVPSPNGAEQEMRWIIEKKVTDYIQYEITFDVHLWDMQELEIEQDGLKKPIVKARIYIIIKGKMIYDWQNKFGGSKFAEKLGDWYNQIMHKDIDSKIDPLYYRMWNLHAIIRKYFDMQAKKYAYKGYLGED
ncbi:MAG: hypothetical protein AABW48_01765 [Nanoarchaeota archaeon]